MNDKLFFGETHQRLQEGIPDGVEVDLSLVRLPDDALIFPNPPTHGQDFSFTEPRLPQSFSVQFAKRAGKLGFPDFDYHHLRGPGNCWCASARC